MADFGTVLSVAQTLFAALDCSLLAEACSGLNYESELERLKTTVTTVKSVLVDAGKKPELSQTDLNYIHKLKDAVYDADDLFDKFLTIAARKQNNNLSDKVRHFFSPENPFKVAHSISRDVKKIRSHLDEIADDRSKFGFSVDMQPLRRRREETCSYVYVSDVVGRDGDTTKIIRTLLDSTDDVGFLTIVGVGGLGKTTLAKLVFSDQRIIEFGFNERLWVCVADQDGTPFDVKVILSKMLESAGCNVDKHSSIERVSSEYQSKLGGKKFLIVLDDVWTENMLEWRKLREFLIIGGKGSRIIVTTRSKETARIVGDGSDANTHDLQGLSEEDSWCLFEMSAFGKGLKHPKFDDIGKKIVQKCHNLPLAIKVVGSFLYGQSIDTWQLFEANGFAGNSDGAKEVMSILRFSYDQLEPSLKSCFTYCAIFHKDYVIDKENLLNLWDAQGYIVPFEKGQSIDSAGEDHFSVLLRRCFFEDVKKDEYGDIKFFKIHDLMHDLAQRVSESEILIMDSSLLSPKSSARHVHETEGDVYETNDMIKSKIRSYIKNDRRTITSITVGKIVKNWVYLRSLSLVSLGYTSLPEIMGNLIHLRYLNLQNSSISKLPNSIVKLHNLRTLDLNYCLHLEALPKKFSKLVNLRHLDINYTSVEYMPFGMSKLSGLRVLTQFVVKDESASGRQCVGQLNDLKALSVNLKGNILITFPEHFRCVEGYNWEESCLEGAEHLKEVKLSFAYERGEYEEWIRRGVIMQECVGEETILKRLQPHPNLKKFDLYYYKGETIKGWGSAHDNWATFLPNLVQIKLLECKGLQQLPLLSKLLHLRRLNLSDLWTLEYVEEVSSSSSKSKFTFFPSLESLEIENCKNLKGWWRDDSGSRQRQPAFPRLSTLYIKSCCELTSFPPCPSLHTLYLRKNNRALRISSDEGQSSSSNPLSCYDEKSGSNQNNGKMKVGLFEVDCMAHLKQVASPLVTELYIRKDHEVESLSEVEEMFKSCSSLNCLRIDSCSKLRSLCGGLEHLSALHSLTLTNCKLLELEDGEHVDGNGMPWRPLQSSLRSLTLNYLPSVQNLPTGMQYLTSLQDLNILTCTKLKSLPEWISCSESLQSLYIWSCSALKKGTKIVLNKKKPRSQEPNGEDRPKIKHIPQIDIEFNELIE